MMPVKYQAGTVPMGWLRPKWGPEKMGGISATKPRQGALPHKGSMREGAISRAGLGQGRPGHQHLDMTGFPGRTRPTRTDRGLSHCEPPCGVSLSPAPHYGTIMPNKPAGSR